MALNRGTLGGLGKPYCILTLGSTYGLRRVDGSDGRSPDLPATISASSFLAGCRLLGARVDPPWGFITRPNNYRIRTNRDTDMDIQEVDPTWASIIYNMGVCESRIGGSACWILPRVWVSVDYEAKCQGIHVIVSGLS